jgi:hypothetical protein
MVWNEENDDDNEEDNRATGRKEEVERGQGRRLEEQATGSREPKGLEREVQTGREGAATAGTEEEHSHRREQSIDPPKATGA